MKRGRTLVFTLNEWTVDTDRCLLEKGGVEHRLESVVMQLLEFLARHHDRPLSRRELIDGVWGGRYVSPGTLAAAISVLREALGDRPGRPGCIQTIPGYGYRLLAKPVTPAPVRADPPRRRRSRMAQRWPIAFAVALASVATWFKVALHQGF